MWHLKEIPRVAHFFWDGEKLSYLRYLTLVSFRLLNPGWEVILYTSVMPQKKFCWKSGEQNYDNNYVDCYDRIANLDIRVERVDFDKIGFSNDASSVHKSDYLRWKLLHEVGGLWSDMDILYFRSMDELSFNKPYMSRTNTVVCTSDQHSIGFLMGSKGNEYYGNVHKASAGEYKKDGYQSIGSLLCHKLYPTLSSISSANNIPFNLPMDVVYSYDFRHVDELFAKESAPNRMTKNTIGIHWYGGHQVSGKWLNENNGGLLRGGRSIIDKKIEFIQELMEPAKRPVKPTLSVVMAFYNRQELLNKTLEGLDRSAIKDYELIIIDDASTVPLVCDKARVIRVEKKDKWYSCSAVAWNRALREATGDIILMQSPECYHAGDIMKYAVDKVRPNLYLSFGCYAIGREETVAFGRGVFPVILDRVVDNARHGWYNHTKHRPVAYHFCSAIMRKDMDMIGGFDERYGYGYAYDDDEFIRTVRYMGMEVKIIDDPFVIHQYHSHFEFDSPAVMREPHALNQLIYNQGYNAKIHRDYGRDAEPFDPVKFKEMVAAQARKVVHNSKKKKPPKPGENVLKYFLKGLEKKQ
jgi:glycosyltransferase involved in cell wall biosynthesis